MRNKKEYYSREFLNKAGCRGGLGAIRCGEGSIRISDCGESVNLEFWIDDYTEWRDVDNIEHKIDVLYDSIKKFRSHIKRKIKKHKKSKDKDRHE